MEKHVTNLTISKRLKELGVKQEIEYYHWIFDGNYQKIVPAYWAEDNRRISDGRYEFYSAFLASELGEVLPKDLNIPFKNGRARAWDHHIHIFHYKHSGWNIYYSNNNANMHPSTSDKSLPDAMGKMLIYLLENNLLSLDGKVKE